MANSHWSTYLIEPRKNYFATRKRSLSGNISKNCRLTLSVSSSWVAPLHPKSVPLNVNPLWISAWHTFLCSTNFESCLEEFKIKINHGIAPPRLCNRDCSPLQQSVRPGYELFWIFLKSVRQFLHSKITSVYCNKSAFPMIKFKPSHVSSLQKWGAFPDGHFVRFPQGAAKRRRPPWRRSLL